MNERSFAALACRILALWLFYQASLLLGSVFLLLGLSLSVTATENTTFVGDKIFSAAMAGGIPGTVALVMAIFFWVAAGPISRRMVRGEGAAIVGVAGTGANLLTVALVTVGMMLLINALQEASRLIVQLAVYKEELSPWSSGLWRAEISAAGAKILLSLLLLATASRWGRWWFGRPADRL